ncbi:MAG: hypothetical protein GKC07_02830 [Methanomicrobiales archaeon]|nr:hypothetical protein [Methanomicrobiales archaeon]
MDDSVPLRKDEDVKLLLKEYLTSMDLTIARELDEDGNWGFWIRFGNYPILIDHRKGSHFCVVAFQITLKDEHAIEHLNQFYEKNDAQFVYELTRAFTSPLTGYTRIIERGSVIGYTISKYIYPYHSEFNMRTLDIALQAVVSTGAVGASFLKWMARVIDFQHERGIEPGDTDPTRLFV